MDIAKYPDFPVILVDDEAQSLQSASFSLRSAGLSNIIKCQDSRDVMALVEKNSASVVVCDLLMPYKTGREVLFEIAKMYPDLPVIMVTAVNDVETAVDCIKLGAIDYIVKPIDKMRLVTSVKKAIDYGEMKAENNRLRSFLLSDKLKNPDSFAHIITQSHCMQSIFGYVEAVSQTSMPVLVSGETGSGKEMIARAVHNASGRTGEFVQVNVAGLDDTLFSDTLFGHEKGAFTGAEKARVGLIAKAKSGTIFLDEIGDLSLESQVKLLRLLEDHSYYPLGSDVSVLTDAKVVVATNRDLALLMKEHKFRSDLFYRLQTHHIIVPSLRERAEDIPVLADFFMECASIELKKKKPTPPSELYLLLATYSYPGNVRELKSLMYDAVSRHRGGVLSLDSFKEKIAHSSTLTSNGTQFSQGYKDGLVALVTLPAIRDAEQLLVDEALSRAKGNQSVAAGMLGITRSALNKRINKKE